MFELNKNNNTLKLKRDGVKYIAKFSSFDKKFVFKREFINGFQISTHHNTFILEVCTTKNEKSYHVIDSKNNTVTRVDYTNLIDEKKQNEAEFCYKYFR